MILCSFKHNPRWIVRINFDSLLLNPITKISNEYYVLLDYLKTFYDLQVSTACEKRPRLIVYSRPMTCAVCRTIKHELHASSSSTKNVEYFQRKSVGHKMVKFTSFQKHFWTKKVLSENEFNISSLIWLHCAIFCVDELMFECGEAREGGEKKCLLEADKCLSKR